MAAIDDLIAQIQAQGTTDKWTGGYGADAATRDMARILNSIGITDINQFGKIPKYEPVVPMGKIYNGQPVRQIYYEDGVADVVNIDGNWTRLPEGAKTDIQYGEEREAGTDDLGNMQYVAVPVDQANVSIVNGKPVVKTGETFGNKETGQAVPITYSERQTGNAFGGTFEGSGNTGYRVDFTPEGTPIFYTTGASSSNVGEIIKPFAQMALLAAGIGGLESLGLGAGGGAVAGTAAGSAGAAGMTAAELAQLDLALGGVGGSAGATSLGNALLTGATVPTVTSLTGGSGLLTGTAGGITADSVAAKLAEGATGMGGGSGLLGSAMTEAELAQLDMALGGSGGSAGAAELGSALATGAPTVTNTALTGGSGVFTGAAGGITPESVAAKLSEGVAPVTSATAATSPLSVSDAIRLAGVVATVAGAGKLASNLSSGGGYPIVPVPSSWTPPVTPTTTQFTPLTPIDFGSKELLRGTQWEQLLSPDYGKAPVPPTSTNPSNMSYSQLMNILGGNEQTMPSQSVSINDVIAGIQSQYGQTPQGSVG